jgi:type IV pilus assembly protein PilN
MPRINLLPWREAHRKVKRREFALATGAAVVAGIMFALGGKLMYSSWIDAQTAKNDLLKKEIGKLDAQITDILDLENRKQRLLARMEIIEKLQRSRPEIVHVFDEIVRTLPEGVYLTAIKQNDKKLKFEGVAQSSTRVSSFMRNIDGSQWLRNPELEVVQTTKGSGPGSSFTLSAYQVSTAGPDDGGARVPKGKIRKASAGGAGAPQ